MPLLGMSQHLRSTLTPLQALLRCLQAEFWCFGHGNVLGRVQRRSRVPVVDGFALPFFCDLIS
jgi:hypothetical protein